MLKNKATILLAILLSISACKKDEIEPDIVEEPQFYIKGKIDGVDFKYEAGVDNVIAQTHYGILENVRVFNFDILKEGKQLGKDTIKFVIGITSKQSPPPAKTYDDGVMTLVAQNYNYLAQPDMPGDPVPNSAVVITWYQAINNVYNSGIIDQTAAQFNISKVEQIERNGNNYITVQGTFNCTLKNYDNPSTVELTDGEFRVTYIID